MISTPDCFYAAGPMPTHDEADSVAHATRAVLEQHGPHLGDWPEGVRVEAVDANVEDDRLIVRTRFSDVRFPDQRLGTAFEVDEIFWTANDGVLDADWAAMHAYAHFCEATCAGGHPQGWTQGSDGVRWHHGSLL